MIIVLSELERREVSHTFKCSQAWLWLQFESAIYDKMLAIKRTLKIP